MATAMLDKPAPTPADATPVATAVDETAIPVATPAAEPTPQPAPAAEPTPQPAPAEAGWLSQFVANNWAFALLFTFAAVTIGIGVYYAIKHVGLWLPVTVCAGVVLWTLRDVGGVNLVSFLSRRSYRSARSHLFAVGRFVGVLIVSGALYIAWMDDYFIAGISMILIVTAVLLKQHCGRVGAEEIIEAQRAREAKEAKRQEAEAKRQEVIAAAERLKQQASA